MLPSARSLALIALVIAVVTPFTMIAFYDGATQLHTQETSYELAEHCDAEACVVELTLDRVTREIDYLEVRVLDPYSGRTTVRTVDTRNSTGYVIVRRVAENRPVRSGDVVLVSAVGDRGRELLERHVVNASRERRSAKALAG